MKSLSVIILAFSLYSCQTSKQNTSIIKNEEVVSYTTAQGTDYKISKVAAGTFIEKPQPAENEVVVFVEPAKTFQTFIGVGGALTDAAAETFYKLPESKRNEFITAYFNKEKGLGYTLARTNIHSCDFSSDMYTYVTDSTDKELRTFDISHDRKYRIPFIKEAIQAAGGNLMLYGSPWSPPAFMKTNGNMKFGGKLKPEFYRTWALYYTKFIKAYEKEGIPVWGISIQNEPMATQIWESCLYTAEEERDFLKNYLGPVMEQEGLKNKKIVMWDHNRDLILQRANIYFKDPAVAKYAWGIGFHWYEDWSGGNQMFDNLRRVYETYPDKPLMFTEGCNGPFAYNDLNQWKLGERYGRSMIEDFNNGMTGFTDWNILLDETGGPNHVKNFCFAPIHADTRTGELIYTNAYYYIGHFSKFVKPGAKRIVSSASRSQLLTTAFVNPDGKIVVIVMNQSANKTNYFLWQDGKAVELTSLPHSISTVIY